jgi:hypothetical protein
MWAERHRQRALKEANTSNRNAHHLMQEYRDENR